jgi:RHH-type proline utilization regulon transcriptional repressor/proline dehydrogenase/delta 1-pyrroline-5-carboxylate dehydrogenase
MLGEAAMTAADAAATPMPMRAPSTPSPRPAHDEIAANPGISVKLSALHPRYEVARRPRVMAELVPRVLDLARKAAERGDGLQHRRRGGRPARPVARR